MRQCVCVCVPVCEHIIHTWCVIPFFHRFKELSDGFAVSGPLNVRPCLWAYGRNEWRRAVVGRSVRSAVTMGSCDVAERTNGRTDGRTTGSSVTHTHTHPPHARARVAHSLNGGVFNRARARRAIKACASIGDFGNIVVIRIR